MKNLVIIGASALGRKVCNYARDAGWNVVGFLDDNPSRLDGFAGYPPVLTDIVNYKIKEDEILVSAVGDSGMREKYTQPLIERGACFANIIHPLAYIGRNVKLGSGCVICPYAVLDCDLMLGNHVVVNVQSLVAHDCVLDDFSTVSPGCHLGGGTHLCQKSFLGIHSATIPHAIVGEESIIAAGAVVTRPIPPSVLAVGIPAQVKKELQ